MIQGIVLVMIGGAAGSAARYLITQLFLGASRQTGFPLGTLIVNVAGCFVVSYALATPAINTNENWRLIAAAGFCGGFTTFSTFAYESIMFWESGRLLTLILNIGLNNMLSLAAVVLGFRLRTWI